MWYRVDLVDGTTRMIETAVDLTKMDRGDFIRSTRTIFCMQGKPEGEGANQRRSLLPVDITKLNPLYATCKENYMSFDLVKEFGEVDESHEVWNKIRESALDDSTIFRPKLVT